MKTKLFLSLVLLFSVMVHAEGWQALVKPTPERYKTVSMNPAHVQKDALKGVQYLSEEQREQIRLVIKNGVVYNHVGEPVPDSVNHVVGHINHVNYVMDAEGNFYLFNEFANPKVRHSSIFAGQPVAGAGEITIKNAHVVYIDADSGHYPSTSLMPNVLKQLKSDGVDLQTVALK